MQTAPLNCLDCPLARPLHGVGVASPLENRFSCGNSPNQLVRGHFPATAECHDAIIEQPHRCLVAHKVEETSTSMRRYFQPLALVDLQGLEAEWICEHIRLTLNWLAVFEDTPVADGDIVVEVCHQDLRIGYLRHDGDAYYCDRVVGLRTVDPYLLALNLVHSDYLVGMPDEIVTARASFPDYI